MYVVYCSILIVRGGRGKRQEGCYLINSFPCPRISIQLQFFAKELEEVYDVQLQNLLLSNICSRSIFETLQFYLKLFSDISQNTMHSLNANTRVRETDVAGDCEVEYQVLKQGYGVSKVKKIKDVLGCVNGHGHESFFQGIPYKVPSVSLHIYWNPYIIIQIQNQIYLSHQQ